MAGCVVEHELNTQYDIFNFKHVTFSMMSPSSSMDNRSRWCRFPGFFPRTSNNHFPHLQQLSQPCPRTSFHLSQGNIFRSHCGFRRPPKASMSLVKKLVDRTGIKHWFAKSKIDSKIASTAPAPTALVPTAPASTAPFHFINPKDFEWGRVFLWDIEPSVIPEDLVDFFGQYNFEA